MSILITAARTALILASLLGYVHTVSKKIKPELSLGFIFSCIGGGMFLAGILNILPETAWAICIAGVALLVRALYRRESFRALLCPGMVFFLACAVLLPIALYVCEFDQPDNFTHWGVAVKRLLQHNRFPIASDDSRYPFNFPSYPLGSTCFIYYFTYLIGLHPEWLQVYIQSMLIAGALTGLFVFARQRYAVATAAFLCIFILWADTPVNQQLFYSLLVDILLPSAALSAVSFCVFYREQLAEKLWWTAPYTVFLMSIKNSGIFFAAVVLVYALAVIKERRRNLPRWLGCALCPAAALLLWQRHVRLVFPHGLTAKHSMSLENFRNVFADKSPEDVRTILGLFRDSVFSLSNPVLYILAALILVYLFRRFILRSDLRSFRRAAVLAAASYVAYMIALAAMYLLTMPLNEALRLAGSDRYIMTILIFLIGLVFIDGASAIGQLPPSQPRRSMAGALCVAMLALGLLTLTPNPQYLRGQDMRGTQREVLDEILEQHDIPTGQYCLMISPSTDDFWIGFYDDILIYLRDPEFIAFQPAEFMTGKDFLLSYYDYVIALEETDDVRAYMEKTFGDPDLRVVKLDRVAE